MNTIGSTWYLASSHTLDTEKCSEQQKSQETFVHMQIFMATWSNNPLDQTQQGINHQLIQEVLFAFSDFDEAETSFF